MSNGHVRLHLEQHGTTLTLEGSEVAGTTHHEELELVAGIEVGTVEPLTSDDRQGQECLAAADVDKIDLLAQSAGEACLEPDMLGDRGRS